MYHTAYALQFVFSSASQTVHSVFLFYFKYESALIECLIKTH